jgi:uncharacterized RmlC-like cupin family protein
MAVTRLPILGVQAAGTNESGVVGRAMDGLCRIRPEDRVEGAPTPGMTREEAVATDGMWAGFLTTAVRMTSGWHHHGEYETSIYVVTGMLRMEFGPGGTKAVEAVPGDFLYVGKGVIHRESNPSEMVATAIVVRAGTGEAVFNVDGPEPAGR